VRLAVKFTVRVPLTTFPDVSTPDPDAVPTYQKYSAAFVDAVHVSVPPVADNELSVTAEIVLGVMDVKPCSAGT
jgi:hypothetical protein